MGIGIYSIFFRRKTTQPTPAQEDGPSAAGAMLLGPMPGLRRTCKGVARIALYRGSAHLAIGEICEIRHKPKAAQGHNLPSVLHIHHASSAQRVVVRDAPAHQKLREDRMHGEVDDEMREEFHRIIVVLLCQTVSRRIS